MMLRIQLERMSGGFFPSLREYHQRFGLTEERVRRAKKDVVILHPGPMNRGVEIASEVAGRALLGDPRPGHERRGGAHGRALSAPRGRPGDGGMSGRLLLKGGRVVDPANGIDAVQDVLMGPEGIEEIRARVSPRGAQVVDAKGLVVCPGFIDLHTHLREPGRRGQGDHPHGHAGGGRRGLHRRVRHAQHRPRERPRGHHAVHPREGGARKGPPASIRSGPSPAASGARSWRSSATCATRAAWPSPTTAAPWRAPA